jgi:hypothetical protein
MGLKRGAFADANRLERMLPDKNGEPIPILGTLQSDDGNIAEVQINNAASVDAPGALEADAVYMLIATQTSTAVPTFCKIRIYLPNTPTTNPITLTTITGQLIWVFKARTADIRVDVVTSTASAGMLFAVSRLG